MSIRERVLATIRRSAAVLSLLLVATACGGPPTGEEAGSSGDDPFAAVLDKLKGLEGEARTERLVKLAKQEDGLQVYTSNTDLGDETKVFTDRYGIKVEVYRAKANQVLQRLLQEANAKKGGADVYDSNAEELATAQTEGLLRDYQGPAAKGLVDAAQQEGWVGSRLNVFTVSWNTKVVSQPPTSFEDLADKRFAGKMMIEPRAFEWYMALSGHLTEEEGMSQAEVDELFSKIAANSVQVEGNTTQAQFLGSGEYGVSVSAYNHLVDELTDQGAPVARTPAVEPLVVRPNGVGLLRSASNPASALLFMEWQLTEAQQAMVEDFRVPARAKYQGDALKGMETVTVDVDQLVSEGAEWEKRYEKVLRKAKQA